jgi:HEAT repeat protein
LAISVQMRLRGVPALIALLETGDEGARNSACIALRGIGPAARPALGALRAALSDPSADVRGFAERAISGIEGQSR